MPKAPPVMEFDPEGNLDNSWGDAKVLGDYVHDCFKLLAALPLGARLSFNSEGNRQLFFRFIRPLTSDSLSYMRSRRENAVDRGGGGKISG
jgi:hypothetical protein